MEKENNEFLTVVLIALLLIEGNLFSYFGDVYKYGSKLYLEPCIASIIIGIILVFYLINGISHLFKK